MVANGSLQRIKCNDGLAHFLEEENGTDEEDVLVGILYRQLEGIKMADTLDPPNPKLEIEHNVGSHLRLFSRTENVPSLMHK